MAIYCVASFTMLYLNYLKNVDRPLKFSIDSRTELMNSNRNKTSSYLKRLIKVAITYSSFNSKQKNQVWIIYLGILQRYKTFYKYIVIS